MPLTTIFVLAGIVAIFGIFGVGLFWAEHQTRNLRSDPPVAEKRPRDDLKMAA